jgi:predicted aspartyl protease
MRAWCGPALLSAAALLFFTAPAASAEEYTAAPLSLGQLQAKIGGAEGQLQPGRYAILEQDSAGGVNTVIATRLDGDDFATVEQSAAFKSAYGEYHGQAWEQNANGLVIYKNRSGAATGGAAPAVLLGLTETEPREYAVERRLSKNRDVIRYYNAATFLLDRKVTHDTDGVVETVAYSDYRKVFGEQRAFKWSYSDGRPANDESGEIVAFTKDGSGASLAPPDSRPLYTIAGNPVSVPAKFGDHRIVVTLQAQGQKLDFLLDTGAGGLNIDAGALSRLGIHPYGRYVQRIAGDFDVSQAIVPELAAGGVQMRNVAFDVIPDGSGGHVGILGCDFLAASVVELNYKNGTVTLHPPQSFDAKALAAYAVPADYSTCVPRIHASIAGTSGTFILDTGAANTMLTHEFAQRVRGLQPLSQQFTFDVSMIGGAVESKMYMASNLVVGAVQFNNASVIVPFEGGLLWGEDGLIGDDVLRAFTVYLDYANNVVYLKPNS